MGFRAFGSAQHSPSLIGPCLDRWCSTWASTAQPACRSSLARPTNLEPGPGLAQAEQPLWPSIMAGKKHWALSRALHHVPRPTPISSQVGNIDDALSEQIKRDSVCLNHDAEENYMLAKNIHVREIYGSSIWISDSMISQGLNIGGVSKQSGTLRFFYMGPFSTIWAGIYNRNPCMKMAQGLVHAKKCIEYNFFTWT